MALSSWKNFAKAIVTIAPDPDDTGTALGISEQDALLFPDPAEDGEFNAIILPSFGQPSYLNAEIVRVTAMAEPSGGDVVLTIVREQEDSSARNIQLGDRVYLGVTAEMLNTIMLALAIGGDLDNPLQGILDEDTMASDSAVKGVTQQSVKAYVDNGTWFNGWIPTSALTRVSDTTATLVGDWTDRIQKGDKIWWLSNSASSASRWNYVVANPVYSAPNTTITITSGYVTTANDSRFESGHTITEPYISHIESPVGFPHWFNWTPTLSASGSMTWTSTTITTAQFMIRGLNIFFRFFIAGTTGGTASGELYVSAPFNYSGGATQIYSLGNVQDGGGALCSAVTWDRATATIRFAKFDRSNFGLGSSRVVRTENCIFNYAPTA